jgi:hypothetical protein
MKKILIALALTSLLSCNSRIELPAPYHDAPTQFIVTDVKQLDGMKILTTYYIEVVDVNGLSHDANSSSINLKFQICDTAGKYKLGQPIHFDKFR